MAPSTDDKADSIQTADSTIRRGTVELICGCMFSGKTTALLDILNQEPADAIAVFKHHRDDRYSRTRIATHNGDGCEAIHVEHAADILDRVGEGVEVVAIDEGHFYDNALPDVCAKLAQRGKRVIVTALDLDMWGQPFDTIERLREIAGSVRVLRARCARCHQPATHTHRITPIVNRNLVGGGDDFEPRCRNCWSPPDSPRITSDQMR